MKTEERSIELKTKTSNGRPPEIPAPPVRSRARVKATPAAPAKAPPARRAPAAAAQEPAQIEIPRLNIQHLSLMLVGDSALICHAWSQKAKQEMLAKQMKKAKGAKQAKNPDQDFQDSLYPMPTGGGYGFPAVAFKAAAVDACSHVDGVTKVEARGAFHITGEL